MQNENISKTFKTINDVIRDETIFYLNITIIVTKIISQYYHCIIKWF